MLLTYVRRELRGRLRQTMVVAIGLALAVALVLVVNAASAGIRDAQSTALEGVYGVGTDITVRQAATPGEGGGQRFQFGAGDGAAADGGTTVAQDNLTVDRGTTAISDDALTTVLGVDGVADATATLALTDNTFSGTVADPSTTDPSTTDPSTTDPSTTDPSTAQPGGGRGGFGGGDFDVTSVSVVGVEPGTAALGPLAGADLADGRGFTADDATAAVALVSQSYADSATLAVGDTVTIKGTALQVVGVLDTDTSTTTLSDVYLPLATAQSLAGLDGQVTDVYVQADSADSVSAVAADIQAALPDATVSSEEDLAAGITGSLSSASSLVQRLGTWLSVAVLAAAFALAVLFTISGVTRRTRDFGTLKAIGWSNGRIVRQVGVEALVQGALGAALGLVVGLVAIVAVNAAGITLSGSTSSTAASAAAAPDAGAFGGPPGGGGPAAAVSSTVDAVLHAPVNAPVIALAVGLALAGGLLAGVIGGWRAARLRPSAALRSLD